MSEDQEREIDQEREATRRPRPLWSGTLWFGLVRIPFSLFAGNRAGGIALRLVDADGTPLRRRYFCSREDRLLGMEEIERGYEVEQDRFVAVSDEELAALAPRKSREIDLQRFVPVGQIDPIYFERVYFLVPNEGAAKASRLLARTLEERGRAGITTFVMHGKEYLVAILGEGGLLRAEILRFHDELRSPADLGLPAAKVVDRAWLRAVETAMNDLASDTLEREALVDTHTRRLRELIERKIESGTDILAAPPPEEEPEAEEGTEMVDLIQILRRGLDESPPGGRQRSSEEQRGARQRKALVERSKSELYALAKERQISGRSNMSKEQLVEAIRQAS